MLQLNAMKLQNEARINEKVKKAKQKARKKEEAVDTKEVCLDYPWPFPSIFLTSDLLANLNPSFLPANTEWDLHGPWEDAVRVGERREAGQAAGHWCSWGWQLWHLWQLYQCWWQQWQQIHWCVQVEGAKPVGLEEEELPRRELPPRPPPYRAAPVLRPYNETFADCFGSVQRTAHDRPSPALAPAPSGQWWAAFLT